MEIVGREKKKGGRVIEERGARGIKINFVVIWSDTISEYIHVVIWIYAQHLYKHMMLGLKRVIS